MTKHEFYKLPKWARSWFADKAYIRSLTNPPVSQASKDHAIKEYIHSFSFAEGDLGCLDDKGVSYLTCHLARADRKDVESLVTFADKHGLDFWVEPYEIKPTDNGVRFVLYPQALRKEAS